MTGGSWCCSQGLLTVSVCHTVSTRPTVYHNFRAAYPTCLQSNQMWSPATGSAFLFPWKILKSFKKPWINWTPLPHIFIKLQISCGTEHAFSNLTVLHNWTVLGYMSQYDISDLHFTNLFCYKGGTFKFHWLLCNIIIINRIINEVLNFRKNMLQCICFKCET